MAAIHISDTLDQQFEAFAHASGQTKDDLVRDALLAYLEDRQDAALAAARYKNAGQRTSLADVGRELGLDN